MPWLVAAHRALATAVGMMVLVLMFIIVLDSGGRFLAGRPFQGAVEISRVVLAWILFLSLAWALVQKVHVRVDLLLLRLSERPRLAVEIAIILLSLVFFGIAVYGGWGQFRESFALAETMAAPIWIPFWLAKLALPVGCLLIATQLGIDLVVSVRRLARRR